MKLTNRQTEHWFERWAIGGFFAAIFIFFGVRGVLLGEIWVPGRGWKITGVFGANFSGLPGLVASTVYALFGGLIHYIFFWLVPHQKGIARDPLVFGFLISIAVLTFGFVALVMTT